MKGFLYIKGMDLPYELDMNEFVSSDNAHEASLNTREAIGKSVSFNAKVIDDDGGAGWISLPLDSLSHFAFKDD